MSKYVDKVPPVDSALNVYVNEAIGNKTDAASSANTASLMAHTKNIEGALGAGASLCIPDIEMADLTYVDSQLVFSIALVNRSTGAVIPEGDIVAGTIDIHRIRAGVETLITDEAALVKKDGLLEYIIAVANANFQTGDAVVVKKGTTTSTYTIGTTTYNIVIPPQTAIVSDLADVETKLDSVKAITDVLPDAGALTSIAQEATLTASAGEVTAIKAITDVIPDAGAMTSIAQEATVTAAAGEVTAIKAITDVLPDAGALTSLAQDATVAKETSLLTQPKLLEKNMDCHNAAAEYDVATATNGDVLVELLIARSVVDLSDDAGGFTGVSFQTTDATPYEILSAVEGAKANLDEGAQISSTVVKRFILKQNLKIQMSIIGGSADADPSMLYTVIKYISITPGAILI